MQRGRLVAINRSRGGVPKAPMLEGLITPTGLDGDRQRDRRYYGGPDRAVVLFSADVIHALKAEGHPIASGTTGENLTIAGVEWEQLIPGLEVVIGDVHLQLTSYTTPCQTIAASFLDYHFTRISQKVHPGWSRLCARVLTGGTIRPGDAVEIHAPAPPAP